MWVFEDLGGSRGLIRRHSRELTAGPESHYTPYISPNGRYFVMLGFRNKSLVIYDLEDGEHSLRGP